MNRLSIAFLLVFAWIAKAEDVPAVPDATKVDTKSLTGSYIFKTAPGLPFPETDTLTLGEDGTYRFEMLLPGKKVALFVGTWTYAEGVVTALSRERFFQGKPFPSDGGDGWKPGDTLKFRVDGETLYKGDDRSEPFVKSQE